MKISRSTWSLLALSLLLVPALQAQGLEITGTGATFPAKVYQQWAEHYSKDAGVLLSYKPAGSSAGVRQIQAHAVDFGASDVPMSPQDLERHQLFQFPTLVGGVVPVVNLPGVAPGALRLDSTVLARIFAGQIQFWNDKAIQALNPGLKLPPLAIQRIVRADGSGTTEVFVRYLQQSAPEAAAPIQAQGGRAQWPGHTQGVEGSGKLAQAVRATPGSVGYISSDYVLKEQLAPVQLRNKRGDWVDPTVASFRAAIRLGGLFKNDLEATPLIDIDGIGVWPIVTATYVLVPREPVSLERAGRTLHFFYRSFLLGDKAVAGSGFAPLPIATQARIVSLLSGFRTQSGQPVPVLGF